MVSSTLFGESFEQFLQRALQKSPFLEANKAALEQSVYEGAKVMRYQNPSLEFGLASYDLQEGTDEIAPDIAFIQPIRLWGVGDAQKAFASSLQKTAQARTTLQKALFVAKLSFGYARYKKDAALQKLAQEELGIAQTIAKITKERYENGTTAKVRWLQSVLETKRAQNTLARMRANALRSYYELLAASGLTQEVKLEKTHRFGMAQTKGESALVAKLRAEKTLALAKERVARNKVEWIEAALSYDQEPDQNVFRLGVSIPLALFNTKKEERQIAALQAKRKELAINGEQNALLFRLKALRSDIESLQRVRETTRELLASQKELLALYTQGYKNASIDLLELQALKNRLIETKKRQIETLYLEEKEIITYNFLIGAFNE